MRLLPGSSGRRPEKPLPKATQHRACALLVDVEESFSTLDGCGARVRAPFGGLAFVLAFFQDEPEFVFTEIHSA